MQVSSHNTLFVELMHVLSNAFTAAAAAAANITLPFSTVFKLLLQQLSQS
jgi:hypothetical protein